VNPNDQGSIDQVNLSALIFIAIAAGAFLLYFLENLLGYVAGD
jgi:hypothetical protein